MRAAGGSAGRGVGRVTLVRGDLLADEPMLRGRRPIGGGGAVLGGARVLSAEAALAGGRPADAAAAAETRSITIPTTKPRSAC